MENYLRNKIPTKTAKSNQSKKPYKFSHTAGSQKGLGDYYGTGIVAKLGRMRDESMGMQALSLKQMKKPPKSVV
jgi:hypothetical protein